jgi:hypothetical protein
VSTDVKSFTNRVLTHCGSGIVVSIIVSITAHVVNEIQ